MKAHQEDQQRIEHRHQLFTDRVGIEAAAMQDAAYALGYQRGKAELNAVLDVMQEVLRISDRKHDAWDAAKAVIAKAKGVQS